MYGPVKVMINTPIRNNSIFEFRTKIEVMEILTFADGLNNIAEEGIYDQSHFIHFSLTIVFPRSISLIIFGRQASLRMT